MSGFEGRLGSEFVSSFAVIFAIVNAPLPKIKKKKVDILGFQKINKK